MAERPRGFTLIELMIVVAIVGILSSIAVPNFLRYQLRSKQAERAVITKAIRIATDEFYGRDGAYPNVVVVPPDKYSWLNGPHNPSFPPTNVKRRFDPALGDWKRLNLSIVGHVYYTYYLYAYDYGGLDKGGYILTYGDLDGDGRTNTAYQQWYAELVTANGRTMTISREFPANAQLYDYFFSERTF